MSSSASERREMPRELLGSHAGAAAGERRGAAFTERARGVGALVRLAARFAAGAADVARTRGRALDAFRTRANAAAGDIARVRAADDLVPARVVARADDLARAREAAEDLVVAREPSALDAARDVRRARDVVDARAVGGAVDHADAVDARSVRAALQTQIRVARSVGARRRIDDRPGPARFVIRARAEPVTARLPVRTIRRGLARHRAIREARPVTTDRDHGADQKSPMHAVRRCSHDASIFVRNDSDPAHALRGPARRVRDRAPYARRHDERPPTSSPGSLDHVSSDRMCRVGPPGLSVRQRNAAAVVAHREARRARSAHRRAPSHGR